MTGQRPPETRATDLRVPALVIAGTGVVWLVLGWIGAQQGWGLRTMALIDLAAIAGFIWALLVTFWIWQRRRAAPNKE
ncbi:DUF5337 domain-containing protein [Paracoccus pacificus]|uniref:DUF5337 domain-containing protein n=1 Tax=Paracoccus pacificus TaxID=1463598 RepID=A0ABW4RC80_9RHOB